MVSISQPPATFINVSYSIHFYQFLCLSLHLNLIMLHNMFYSSPTIIQFLKNFQIIGPSAFHCHYLHYFIVHFFCAIDSRL